MTALTDYERRRQENIKKNQSLLSSLAIKSIGTSSNKKKNFTPTKGENTTSKKRSRPSYASDLTVPTKRHATRSSVRLNGTTLLDLDQAQSSFLEQDTTTDKEEKKIKEQLRHSDRELIVESWRIPGQKHETDSNLNISLTDKLFKSISTDIQSSLQELPLEPGWSKRIERDREYVTGNDVDYDRLSEQLNDLKLKLVSKVSQTRIYSIAFHRDPTKSLLFIGDKLGGIGICDGLSNSQVKTEDDKENSNEAEPEFSEGASCSIQAHTRYSPISSIQTHPTQAHLIYTSSYDQSIRELNFETKGSIEILNGSQINPEGETCFSNFEFTNSGREIWASDNEGGLSHRDLRLPKLESSRRWIISKKKIGCLSISPLSDDRLAVTAGLNREMRLWDLRALSGLPTETEIAEIEERSCLANYAHKLACSSAFFDHCGSRILSTSYDDLIRIWEFDSNTRSSWLNNVVPVDFAPTYQARHDNQTGRWVSVFKARWCPNPRFPSHFTIANMSQKLDVYNPKGELLTQLKHRALTTVPAVTAQHPTSTSLQIAGGTAGGKVYLWS